MKRPLRASILYDQRKFCNTVVVDDDQTWAWRSFCGLQQQVLESKSLISPFSLPVHHRLCIPKRSCDRQLAVYNTDLVGRSLAKSIAFRGYELGGFFSDMNWRTKPSSKRSSADGLSSGSHFKILRMSTSSKPRSLPSRRISRDSRV